MSDKLVIEIDGDTGPLAGTLGKVQDVGKKAFGAISGAIAGAAVAVGGLITSAIQSYAEFEQLTGGVETLFKTSSDVVIEYANNAYKTAGLSANQYMTTVTGFSASLLQSLGGDTEKAAQVGNMAVTDMADNANKMGTSMEAIQYAYQGFAKQNYTMLDNLKLGYGGTKSEMERLLEDAEKLSGVKYDITNLNDVYNAVHVIQTELGITGTTALEAEETISGSLNAAKSAWANLLTGIADDNQDFDKLVNNFVDSVGIAAKNLLPRIETALVGVGSLITGLLPVIVNEIPAIIDGVLPSILNSAIQIVMTILTGITDNLPLITEKAPEIMWALFNGIISMLPMIGSIVEQLIGTFAQGFLMYNALILQLGITIITALLQGFAQDLPKIIDTAMELIETLTETLIENIPLILEAALQILNGLIDGLINNLPFLIASALSIIQALVTGLIDSIPLLIDAAFKIIDGIIGFLLDNLPMIIQTGVKLLIALVQALPEIITTIVAALPAIITGIIDALLSNLPLIIQAGVDLLIALIENIDVIISTIITAVPTIVAGIVKAFIDNKDSIIQAGKDLISGLWEGITQMWENVKGWVGDIATSITKIFTGEWDVQSPSRVFMRMGQYLMEGLKEGLDDGLGGVLSAATTITEEVQDQFNFGKMLDDAKANLSMSFSGGYGVPTLAYAGATNAAGDTRQSRRNNESPMIHSVLQLDGEVIYESYNSTQKRVGSSMVAGK